MPKDKISSKLFVRFQTLHQCFDARKKMMYEKYNTDPNLPVQFFDPNKFKADEDPIRRDGTLYGKPIIGLVESLALAYLHESRDMWTYENIGFSSYPDCVHFELYDFAVYVDAVNPHYLSSLNNALNEKNYDEVRKLLIPVQKHHYLNDYAQTLALMMTDHMIETALSPLLLTLSTPGLEIPAIPPPLNKTNAININEGFEKILVWDWKQVLNVSLKPEQIPDFEQWCKNAIKLMQKFPLEQAEFIMNLANHSALNDPLNNKRSAFGEAIDAIVHADNAEDRQALINKLPAKENRIEKKPR